MTLLVAFAGLLSALLEVHFIDVGQGDAALVVSPERRTVLIDAGPPEAGAHIARYLRERGIGPVDLAIVTHPHLDHMGGMARIVTEVGAKRYMDPAFVHPLDTYKDLLMLLEARKLPVLDATPGRKIALDSGVVLEVLWPAKPFLSGTRSDVNANSVVARLTYGRTSFLFMGDAEADTERALLKRGAELSARVLKVAHHGSSYSTSSEFLAKVKPEQAVISCGRGNDYGHPAPETLERLKKAHVEVHRTDLDGGIVFRSDGDSLDVETGVARLADAGLGAAPAGGAVAAPAENGTRASGPGAAASGAAAAGSGAATASGLLDLNAASEGDLDALPGIGPSKARAIIDWRDRNGKFTSVDQLDEVKGIGPAMLEKIRPHVTVGGSAPATAPASALAAAAPAPAPGSAPGAPAPDDVEKEAPTGKVNINTASAEDLTALQGVGAALAQRIIDYRQAHGPFRRIADLDAVKGVGPAFLDKNRYFITVKVDLNEAAEAALRAVGLSDKTARALVEARSARGGKFKNTDEVRALVPAREWQNAEGLLWIAGG